MSESTLVRRLRGEIRDTRAALRASEAKNRRMSKDLEWFHDMIGRSVRDRGGLPEEALRRQSLDDILGDDKKLKIASSCARDEFEFKLERFMSHVEAGDTPLFSGRLPDPGNRCKLTEAQALLLALVHKNHSLTEDFLGLLFGISQGTVSDYLKFVRPILNGILPVPKKIGKRANEPELLPGRVLIIDATHTPMQRPADADARREAYSGKEKAFTANTTIITNRDGLVLFAGKPHGGSTHDLTQLRLEDPDLGSITRSMKNPNTPYSQRITVYVDKGYAGIEDLYPGAIIIQPEKRPKGGRLTARQNARNRNKNSVRVIVEHAIGRIKRFGILTKPYDGTREDLYWEIQIAAGMANFHLLWDKKNKKLMHGF